jgi:hypothetical protein
MLTVRSEIGPYRRPITALSCVAKEMSDEDPACRPYWRMRPFGPMTLRAFGATCRSATPSPIFFFCLHAFGLAALGQSPESKTATSNEMRAFFQGTGKTVLTFVGYSGVDYEDPGAMLARAEHILTEFDPTKTVVNIGATSEGIGRVYEIARRRGFVTTGIVSTQAKQAEVPLSPYVDFVFYVEDATWGGNLAGSDRLSPTSEAMVENSNIVIGFGGGEIARDELIAAKRSGKQVRFFPAEMNHQKAEEAARKKGLPPPRDFRGAAASMF